MTQKTRTITDERGTEWLCQQTSQGGVGWRSPGQPVPIDTAQIRCEAGDLLVRVRAPLAWRDLPDAGILRLIEEELDREGKRRRQG